MSALFDLTSWHARNQLRLMAEIARVRDHLNRYISTDLELVVDSAPDDILRDADSDEQPWPLDALCAAFDLTPFERSILLLCAGVELDGSLGRLCAEANDDATRAYPNFGLALAALPDPEWFAVTPDGPLRRWRLIDVLDSGGHALTQHPLRIDERVLHYLTGLQQQDSRLAGVVVPLPAGGTIVRSHAVLVERIGSIWSQADDRPMPAIQLAGPDSASKRSIAVAAAGAQGLTASLIAADLIPSGAAEQDTLQRLWEREAFLGGHVLVIDCDDLDLADHQRVATVTRFMTQAPGLLIFTGRERWRVPHRPVVAFDVTKPSTDEQRQLWRLFAGDASLEREAPIDELAAQFNLSAIAIEAVVAETSQLRDSQPTEPERPADEDEPPEHPLWAACRRQARASMDDLAQRIEPSARWRDLILPEPQTETLRTIPLHVRHRARVHEDWGFAGKGGRGLGITALFAGASGTGKTLAAEVLARSLRLDLYRVDLSQVVSKYIGETEKNLFRLFDAAEEGGAVLLFDEADALFGKRSEVKDSHDRYANIEVSYLLQRMETYRGLAILTTNLKSALDTAFLRRIRFIIQFPFPDAAQRARIWRRMFPSETPKGEIDYDRLAQLDLAGGNIRNIALNAAFLAASRNEDLGMEHLLSAARAEYVKLEKPLTDQEIRGWIREREPQLSQASS